MLLLLSAVPWASWTLAFGSCHHQEIPAPGLLSAAAAKPDVFVFLGDNLYNDLNAGGMPCEPIDCRSQGPMSRIKSRVLGTIFKLVQYAAPRTAERIASEVVREHNARSGQEDMVALAQAYDTLGRKPEIVAIRAAVPEVLATWDDHDYCRNDAGASCPWANESQALFLSFWRGEGALANRGERRGVYEAYTYRVSEGGRQRIVRVLLLDTRTFRSDQILPDTVLGASDDANASSGTCSVEAGAGGYCTQPGPEATLLGAEQWRWLEQALLEPADVRIIGSSISFGGEHLQNGDEVWSLFPLERARMLRLLRSTHAGGVVFISGDLHYAEVNEVRPSEGAPYMIHDVCSSGLTMTWPSTAPNAYRVAGPVRETNWGAISIDFGAADPTIGLSLYDAESGERRAGLSLLLSKLQPGEGDDDLLATSEAG